MKIIEKPANILLDAPLSTGEESAIQRYYGWVRFLSMPIILGIIILVSLLASRMDTIWLWIFACGLPLNFLFGHLIISKALVSVEKKKLNVRKIVISDECIMVDMPSGKREFFQYHAMEELKVIYSGFETALLPKGKHFNGVANELEFKYYGRKVNFRFRLPSQAHYAALQDVLMCWAQIGVPFEEYNSTSGLPLASYLCEVK